MIIAMDMDGTLCKDDKTISHYTLKILKQLKLLGHLPVVCSGRGLATLGNTIMDVCDYGILGTGSTIYDLKSKQCLYSQSIDPTILDMIQTKGKNIDSDIDYFCGDEILTDRYTYEHIDHYVGGNIAFANMIRNGRTIVDDPYIYVKENNIPVQRINIFIVDDDIRCQWMDWLRALGLEVSSSAPTNIEITASGVNKGSGLQWLCHYLNINVDQTMMFGDSSNDQAALDYVHYPVVMANASNEMKHKYRYITSEDNNHDGVALFLSKCFHLKF